MKNILIKYVLPIVVVALIILFYIYKNKLLGQLIHTSKKTIIETKKKEMEDALHNISTKIEVEKQEIETNDKHIEDLETKKANLTQEIENAKSNLDELDNVFSEFL